MSDNVSRFLTDAEALAWCVKNKIDMKYTPKFAVKGHPWLLMKGLTFSFARTLRHAAWLLRRELAKPKEPGDLERKMPGTFGLSSAVSSPSDEPCDTG